MRKSKKIDVASRPFINDRFKAYRFTGEARSFIASRIKPEKLDGLVAILEYIGSRVMESMCSEESAEAIPFFNNEFDRSWMRNSEEEEDLDIAFAENPTVVLSQPVFISSMSGEISKISLIMSPKCFEPDLEFRELTRLQ